MSEHVVTFTARVTNWTPGTTEPDLRAALCAECSCGWLHCFIPKVGREAIILEIGLDHVERAND